MPDRIGLVRMVPDRIGLDSMVLDRMGLVSIGARGSGCGKSRWAGIECIRVRVSVAEGWDR